MSNLYKQYNTVELQKDARVIDYNARVEEKLAELAKQQNGVELTEEGFRELSLVAADGADEIPKEDSAEAVKRQLREAEDTLNQAREEARVLIDQAQAQAEDIRQQAAEDGHREGYQASFEEVKASLEAEYGQKKEELELLESKRQAEYLKQMEELEPKLLDVILTVVEKVFHIQFDDKKEILLYLIGNTIAGVEGCKSFRIRVCNEQKSFLEEHKDEIAERIGRDIEIEISADLTMEANECIIETDTGIFDCGTDVQLSNLIKDLRALSS